MASPQGNRPQERVTLCITASPAVPSGLCYLLCCFEALRERILPHGHEGLCAEEGSTKSVRGRPRWVEFTWPDGVPTLLLAPIPRLGVRLRGFKAWFVSRPVEAMHQVVQ